MVMCDITWLSVVAVRYTTKFNSGSRGLCIYCLLMMTPFVKNDNNNNAKKWLFSVGDKVL